MVDAIQHDNGKDDFMKLVDAVCRPSSGRSASVGDFPMLPLGASLDRTGPVARKAKQQKQRQRRSLTLDCSTGLTHNVNDIAYVVNSTVTPQDFVRICPACR